MINGACIDMYNGEPVSQGRFSATSGLTWSSQAEFALILRTWRNSGDDLWRFVLGDATDGIEIFLRSSTNPELTARWQGSGGSGTITMTIADGVAPTIMADVWTIALVKRDTTLHLVLLDDGRVSGTTQIVTDSVSTSGHAFGSLAQEAYVGSNPSNVSSGTGIFAGMWVIGLTGGEADTLYDSGNWGPLVDALLRPENMENLGTMLHAWDQVQTSGGTPKNPTRPTALVAGDLLADTVGGNDLALTIESGKTVIQWPNFTPPTKLYLNSTSGGPCTTSPFVTPTIAPDPDGGYYRTVWQRNAVNQLEGWIGHLDADKQPDRWPIPLIGKAWELAAADPDLIVEHPSLTQSGVSEWNGAAEYHQGFSIIGAPNNASGNREVFNIFAAPYHTTLGTSGTDDWVAPPQFWQIDFNSPLTLASVSSTTINIGHLLSETGADATHIASATGTPTTAELQNTMATYANQFTCSGVNDASFVSTRRNDQANGEFIVLKLPFSGSSVSAKQLFTSSSGNNITGPCGGGALTSTSILFALLTEYSDPTNANTHCHGVVLGDADAFDTWLDLDGDAHAVTASGTLAANTTPGTNYLLDVVSDLAGSTFDLLYSHVLALESGHAVVATVKLIQAGESGVASGSMTDIEHYVSVYTLSGNDLGNPTVHNCTSLVDDNLGSGWHDASPGGWNALLRTSSSNKFRRVCPQRMPTGTGIVIEIAWAGGETLQDSSVTLGCVPYESHYGTEIYAIAMQSPTATPIWGGNLIDLDGTGLVGVGASMPAGAQQLDAVFAEGVLGVNAAGNVGYGAAAVLDVSSVSFGSPVRARGRSNRRALAMR